MYQVLLRMGWIFKTESIIVPAVLDSIGGTGWLRGCLPVFNRFGQSVPPLLMSRRVKVARRKKWVMAACSTLMGISFLTLAVIWLTTGGVATWWMQALFLTLYALFFMATGVNQLCFGTLQGKLIPVKRRGRLLLWASVVGAGCAIACAALLLPLWLRPNSANFGLIFGFAGMCFVVAAASSLLLSEPPDKHTQARQSVVSTFGSALGILRDDRNFRRLATVAALFGMSIMLFPHYQALGREKLGMQLDNLILWVIVQNAGTALFSLPAGALADRRGNRLVLRFAMLAMCAAPLVAIGLSHSGDIGATLFFLVFVLVGLTPVTIKTLNNYTLEIAQATDHPRYLSTLSLCASLPIMVLSPPVGLLIDVVGFGPVFYGIAGLLLIGWILTFRLHEPRHHLPLEPEISSVAIQ